MQPRGRCDTVVHTESVAGRRSSGGAREKTRVGTATESRVDGHAAAAAERSRLVDQGFCVVPGLLPADLLARLGVVTDRMLDALSEEQKQRSGGQGSIVAMEHQDPVFSKLIGLPQTLHALRALGFSRPRYWSGFVIAKEPRSGPLYWHQDWPFWDDPVSTDPLPHQMFLMWYLVDTRPENGCLRVLPRSHRLRRDVHDAIGTGHDDTVRHEDPSTSPAYRRHPDEVDVPVRAGDLVVGDARLLHAAHGNTTARRRTVITMWYLPRYDELSEPLQAAFQERLYAAPPPDLAADELDRIRHLLPDYTGNATPAAWNRIPGTQLSPGPRASSADGDG